MRLNAAPCHPPACPAARTAPRLLPAEWALLAAVAALAALAAWLPALALPEGYHAFADQRTLLGIPYAMDVLTNLAFALAGAWGLWALRRAHAGLLAGQRALAAVFFAGLLLTAASSGYYHLMGPDDAGLCIDRLGMAVAFAGVLGLAAADRVSARAGAWLAALVGVGAAGTAVLHWHTGNMAPWTVLQAGGLALLAWLALRRPLPGALGFSIAGVIAWYAAAKALEMADAPVFAATQQLISGHSAKHLVAALAAWPVIRGIVERDNS